MKNNDTLPTITDLAQYPEITQRHTKMAQLLNCPPPEKFIRDHPMAKGVKYIPIEAIEYLLTAIFKKWRTEVLSTSLVANSITVTVRLHYLDPTDNTWDWQDGVGAMPLQTDKGAAATDFTKVKNDSVMKALPAAKSYAVKDAADNLGTLFGKDLNRKSQLNYQSTLSKSSDDLQAELLKHTNKKI